MSEHQPSQLSNLRKSFKNSETTKDNDPGQLQDMTVWPILLGLEQWDFKFHHHHSSAVLGFAPLPFSPS